MENKPNKTSKPAPQEKNKKEPNYYKKINQIARLLENQKISQIVVHGGKRESKEGEDDKWKISTDLDAESAVILFNLFNKKPLEQIYKEGARTSIIPKDNTAEDLEKIENEDGLTLFIDTGNKWLEIEKQNKKIYIDHHGKGRGPNTSATKMVYDLLKKQNPKIEEENPWLFKYVKGVNDFDNLNYLNREYFNKEHFEQVWPYTLNHIASQMKASDLMNLFNSGIITDFSKSIKGLLNEEIELEKLNQDYSTEIRKIKFGNITLKNGKTINEQISTETSKNIVENNVKKTTTGIENADKFETGLLGKVVFNDNKRIENKNTNGYHKNIIPNHLAFIGTKALGYNTYIAWNEKDKNFFINSNEEGLGEIIKKLNEADPDCALDVRGVMVFGTIKNLTKEQFKKILGLNEKIGNEKIKTNKNLTENEIKIQKNNEEIAELDKKINELNKEIENMDTEIAKLQAMILALPDDEPEPNLTDDSKTTKENQTNEPEKINIDENRTEENSIYVEDFEITNLIKEAEEKVQKSKTEREENIKKLEEEVKNFKGDHIKTLEKKTQLQSTKYSHQLKTETNNKLLNYIKNAENEIEKNFQKALEHRSKSLEDLIKNKLDEKFKEKYKQSIEDTFLLHIKKTKDIQKNFIKDTIKRID
ncbi:MAG: hypothetical protein KBD14_00090 [Candidatus Pacebacteria bacterium]|nr:hypothetical protein [Candidatus Paceibacterota bacterium]